MASKPYEYRPGKWRAYVMVDGRRHSMTTDDKAEAELWIAERTLARKRGQAVEATARRRGGMKVAAFYTEWAASRDNDVDLVPATRAKYRSYWVNHIEPMWGRATLVSITTAKLDKWVREMHRDGVGAATIQGVVNHFGSMLKAAVVDKRTGLTSNPKTNMARLPDVVPKRRKAAPPDALAAILAASKGQYRTLWQLMAESALRWNEAAGLHVRQLDLRDVDRASVFIQSVADRDGTIRMKPKGKKPRRAPLSREVALALRELVLGLDEDDLVFRTEEGCGLRYDNTLDRVWKPTCEAAGVKLNIHELRHTAVTTLLDGNVPAHTVMKIVGHASPGVLDLYTHMTDTAFERAREAMTRG